MFFGNNLHAMLASVSYRANELGDENIVGLLSPFINYMNEAGFPAHEAVRSVGLKWEDLNQHQENMLGLAAKKRGDDVSIQRQDAVRVLYFGRMVFAEPLAYLSGDGSEEQIDSTTVMCRFLNSNQQQATPFTHIQIGDRDIARRIISAKNAVPENHEENSGSVV